MMISTRGRYALRVMADLAEQPAGEFVPLKAVAARQQLSQKYAESIMSALSKAGLVDGAHGKGGGYRLNRAAEQYTVQQILCVTEGGLAPVACLQAGAQPCARAAQCRTLPVWQRLDALVNDYLKSVTLAQLVQPAAE